MRRLGDLADFRNGINYNQSNFGSGIPVVGVKDFQNFTKPNFEKLEEINPDGIVTERNLLRDGDILFVRSNGNRELIGRSLYIESPPRDTTHSAFTIRVRFTTTEAVSRFYAYLFRTSLIRNALSSHGGGTNISNLNQEILNNLVVPTPPRATQERIAGILSAYDDLIQNNLRRIRILEEMARALYREWFVDFRFPGHEREKFVESPDGQLPASWHVDELGNVCDVTMGHSPKSEFYNSQGEGLPFHQGVADFGPRFPKDRLYCSTEARVAEPGDILFSVRAPVGRMNIAEHRIVIGRGLSALRHKHGFQEFLWEQLREKFYEEDMIGNGAIFAAVTKKDMHNVRLVCPANAVVVAATERLRPLHSLIATLSAEVVILRGTRDLLLPRLLSGKINLDDVETVA